MIFKPVKIHLLGDADSDNDGFDNGQEVYGVIAPSLGLRYTDPTDPDIILGDSGGFLP